MYVADDAPEEFVEAAIEARETLREVFISETGIDPMTGFSKVSEKDDMRNAGSDDFPCQLLGFCYENAREMSGQLLDRGISHDVLYVGLKELVEQYEHDGSGGSSSPPRTQDEMAPEANHYTIAVTHPETGETWVIEPVSEVYRSIEEECLGDVYVGPWPTQDFLRLEDSIVEPWERDSGWHWNSETLEVYPESKYNTA